MENPEYKANMMKRSAEQWKNPERKAKHIEMMSGETNPMKRPEIKAMFTGENHPNWKGGVSFDPYCHKFNNQLKERIRNRDNRHVKILIVAKKKTVQGIQFITFTTISPIVTLI